MTFTLVTSGNRGIGLAIVKVLSARLSAPSIVIGCRDIISGKKAIQELRTEGVTVHLDHVELDIENDDSIREAVATVSQRYGKLEFLVNNAARVTQPEPDRLEDVRRAANEVFNNGITSNEVITRAFLPLLRKSPSPRVIMVLSARGSIGMTAAREVIASPAPALLRPDLANEDDKLPPAAVVSYCLSKAALNMLMVHLQREQDRRAGKDTAMVEFWAVSPGHCPTTFYRYRGSRDPEDGAEVVARLLEAEKGEFEAGTFWRWEDGEMKRVKW
ncbi:NAD(P)-binding domain protein [Cordyceps fumosorosea ARSEF 2679]|uniref:NAD(P)-binding domain protein n=1 Tax=Cordyceps fumosorosea (strain ARSEF 2679) TaxID=1081104 RepID=A0A167TRA3_CORFA|nr:NAD(P)-binding domain protein [Cordyceps fumosorosea ARSEF 2679]OAA60863.1 NAD(P)-binding domain protein [Cordyceps fumosorosea ARSEF 2679]